MLLLMIFIYVCENTDHVNAIFRTGLWATRMILACELVSTGTMLAVACLGFPAPGNKVSLGVPTQSVRGSTDAKNELGVKGR